MKKLKELQQLRTDNAQLQYALEQSEKVVADLALLVKQLAHSLKKAGPVNALPNKAMDYLKRKELLGSPLREVPNVKDLQTYHQ